jgi:hypothetical protein
MPGCVIPLVENWIEEVLDGTYSNEPEEHENDKNNGAYK